MDHCHTMSQTSQRVRHANATRRITYKAILCSPLICHTLEPNYHQTQATGALLVASFSRFISDTLPDSVLAFVDSFHGHRHPSVRLLCATQTRDDPRAMTDRSAHQYFAFLHFERRSTYWSITRWRCSSSWLRSRSVSF